jgi:hypothetical protein
MDFPQRADRKIRRRNIFLSLLVKIPRVRREVYHKMMKAEMIKPLVHALKKY